MENIIETPIEGRNTYQRAATSTLRDAAKICDSLGLEWWCEAGTCLGLVRDKDFVAHDSDVDIGILGYDKHQELEEALKKDGWFFKNKFGTPENGYEFAYVKHGVKLDFFFFYEDGAKIWHSAWQAGKQLFLDFPRDIILPVRRERFLDYEVNLPYNKEEYLTCRYGDWQVINKEWNWATDPKCLRKL